MKARELTERYGFKLGCGDNSCILGRPGGMATNGGCRCLPRGVRWTEAEVIEARRLVRYLIFTLTAIGKDMTPVQLNKIEKIEKNPSEVADRLRPLLAEWDAGVIGKGEFEIRAREATAERCARGHPLTDSNHIEWHEHWGWNADCGKK